MDKNSGSGQNEGTVLEIWPLESCRFAYTIGNKQPVRCTWISDQPLFYSDCNDVVEDDDYLDDPILNALERDIADMRDKAMAYDKISADFVEDENATSALFRDDAEFISAPYTAPASGLDAVVASLQQSRLGSQLLSFAQLHNVRLSESSQVSDASYDREAKLILMRPDLDLPTKTLVLARELRRVWQHRNGSGMHPLALHPDFAVLVNRAQNADLLVSMVRVAWELQLAGAKECWMLIDNSTMADLGRAFAREAIADFRSIHNGLAARATFETWFLSERCRKSDRSLIQQMLADYQGYVFSDNTEKSLLIAGDMLCALGKMPFGGNYLESIAQQMLTDPVFTDVRDRSNANFLWFIKFERSFTDIEKEVALEEKAKPKTAEIIAFPKVEKKSKTNKKTASGNAADAEIVSLNSK
ncbi:MAG: DUF6782 family putative metallopeptidase [Pseudomonadota bacterium]